MVSTYVEGGFRECKGMQGTLWISWRRGWWWCVCHATLYDVIYLGPFDLVAISPKAKLVWCHIMSHAYVPHAEQAVMGGIFRDMLQFWRRFWKGPVGGCSQREKEMGAGGRGRQGSVMFLYVHVLLSCCTYFVHNQYALHVQIHTSLTCVLLQWHLYHVPYLVWL